jgi:hypothetical protein
MNTFEASAIASAGIDEPHEHENPFCGQIRKMIETHTLTEARFQVVITDWTPARNESSFASPSV